MNKRTIELEINDTDVAFTVDLAAHNAFLNGITATNKVQPAHNFVMQCCHEEHKPFLRELLGGPAGGGIAIGIAGQLDSEYSPQVQISVKKPKTLPTALETTG